MYVCMCVCMYVCVRDGLEPIVRKAERKKWEVSSELLIIYCMVVEDARMMMMNGNDWYV